MFWKKRRYLVACLAFLGFCNVYIMRVNLSVGIVAMTTSYTVVLENGTTIEAGWPPGRAIFRRYNMLDEDFDWDFKKQGLILSSFFYGYLSTQLLGGWLGARLGGKFVLGVGVLVTALLTTLTPPIATTSFYLFVFARIIEGLFEFGEIAIANLMNLYFQGGTYPAAHALWARWAPLQERSFLVGLSLCGTPVGTVLGLQMSGVLGSILGWRAIFYITGLLSLVWSIVWLLVIKDRPEDDPNISPEELQYIKDSIASVPPASNQINTRAAPRRLKKTALYVNSIEVPCHVISIASQSPPSLNVWCRYEEKYCQLIITYLDVFDYNLAEAGIISSLPYVMMGLSTQFFGGISDWLQNTNVLSTTQIRKIFLSGTLLGQAGFLFLAGHLRSSIAVVLCLIVDLGLEGITFATYYANCLDIAPQHASVLFGISNTFGSSAGVITPLLTSFIVTDKSAEQWEVIFYIASSLMAVGAVFCGVFASGDRQPWAVEQQSTLPCKNGNTGCLNNALSDTHEDKS
ncbi:hypothetical protein J6590_057455 [Homalodisca vitripennis]|nr:hypothetical protein J6590_057455 [Homalodisca vitripennis]